MRAAFTLLEILVAMAVGLPVLVASMAFFRGQSEAYHRGELHMEVAREISLVTRLIYTELKEVHAPVVLDDKMDLWLAGEADGRLIPNRVDVAADGKAIAFDAYALDPPGERVRKKLAFEGPGLVLTEGSRSRRLGRHLKDGRFHRVRGDAEAVRVSFTVEVPSRPGVKPATGSVDLTVRLEGALDVVR